MAKKDAAKNDDLELNEQDAEAVKGGAHRNVHQKVHQKVHQNVHASRNIHKGPNKT